MSDSRHLWRGRHIYETAPSSRMEAKPERPNAISGLHYRRAELAALVKFHGTKLHKITRAGRSLVKRYPTKHRHKGWESVR